MNLAPRIGYRAIYSHAEVAGMLGMTVRQVRGLVIKGKLKKSGKFRDKYPFDQRDVNDFITRLNTRRIEIGA